MSSDDYSDSDAELKELLAEQLEKEKQENEANKSIAKRSSSAEVIAANSDTDNNDPKPKKPRKADKQKTDYEKHLDKIVFGDKTDLYENLKKAANEDDVVAEKREKRKPVWQDSDDEEYSVGDVMRPNKFNGQLTHLDKDKKYSDLLKSKFHRLQAPPKWADLDRKQEDDSDEELLKTVGHLAPSSTSTLPANNIMFKRLKDMNRATYAEGSISSIQFHPSSTVGLIAGTSGIVSVYSIDGRKNEKLHSVEFKGFPVLCAKIFPNGTEVIIGSCKKFCYSYDLMLGEATRVFLPKIITQLSKFEVSPCGKYLAACGRFGDVHLLDSNSKELIRTFKQENPCTALQFTENSAKLIAHSSGSDVTVFDLRRDTVEHVFIDDGCIMGKALALSGNGRLLATGSNEGVVNVYNYSDVLTTKHPQPKKVIYNLTTSISDVKFNSSSEMLGICSDAVPGATKLIHFPTGTVFANFPGFQANVGSIRTLEFSPGSGYLALGNISKQVPLFRLKHFSNY